MIFRGGHDMKRIFLFLTIILTGVSCVEKSDVINKVEDAADETIVVNSFYASAADPEVKTSLVEHSAVHWTKNDAVKVGLFPTTSTYKMLSSVFTANFDGETAQDAHFNTTGWSISDSWAYDNYAIALYPANKIEMSISTSNGTVTSVIKYELPEVQIPVEDGFDNNLNLSFAVVDKNSLLGNNATLYFRNACALIRLNLPEIENLVSFTVTSASDTPLAGTPSNLKSAGVDQNATLTPTWGSGVSNVTLTNSQNIQAGTYYLVVWPGTHSGLTFTFENADGESCEKTFSSSISFKAGIVETFNFKSAIGFKPDEFKISGGPIYGASDLKDGELYVIHQKGTSNYWNANGNSLSVATHSTYDTFDSKSVFEYKEDLSYDQDFDHYSSESAGTLRSLSTGKYLNSDFNLDAELDGALYLYIGNQWKNPNYPYATDAGGDMDVYRGDNTANSLWYYNGRFAFASNANASSYGNSVNNRKWVFYKVVAQ